MIEKQIEGADGVYSFHPKGEVENGGRGEASRTLFVDTYGGRMHIEWDPDASVTPLGQLPFFVQFLKAAELFEPWVEGCPLLRTSPNAPPKVNILGSYFLSALSGQRRYAHITGLRNDTVSAGMLGMSQVMSEDAIRRAFEGSDEKKCEQWQTTHLRKTYEPLLYEPYILDIDTTVKTLYGRQEGAEVGYNPHKPGRPSHTYHTYFVANLRLVMDVEVLPGNQSAAKYSQPGLWKLIDSLPLAAWPAMIRGDCAFGNESMMNECESRSIPYLFKLRMTTNVKGLVRLVARESGWSNAGQGWEAVESRLRLEGWTRERRVVVLRRKLKEKRKRPHGNKKHAPFLPFDGAVPEAEHYEYAVLVTSLEDEVSVIAQHYRDRADAENNFDELKNQWGWGGFVTKDIARCQISARIVAQVYNWWSIFTRLVVPDKHVEAITSRPLLLNAIGRETNHAGQKRLKITSSHAKAGTIQIILTRISEFISLIVKRAEQLPKDELWRAILSAAFRYFLKGRLLAKPQLISVGST